MYDIFPYLINISCSLMSSYKRNWIATEVMLSLEMHSLLRGMASTNFQTCLVKNLVVCHLVLKALIDWLDLIDWLIDLTHSFIHSFHSFCTVLMFSLMVCLCFLSCICVFICVSVTNKRFIYIAEALFMKIFLHHLNIIFSSFRIRICITLFFKCFSLS